MVSVPIIYQEINGICPYYYGICPYYLYITSEDSTFIQFGKEITQRQTVYKEFLRNFDNEEESSFANLENPQGDKEFIKRLVKKRGRYMPRRRGKPIKRIIT